MHRRLSFERVGVNNFLTLLPRKRRQHGLEEMGFDE
jgi:hypothetical protein